MYNGSNVRLLLPPTRYLSPTTAGATLEVALPVTPGCTDFEELTFIVSAHSVMSTSARFLLRLDDSMDGKVTRTHSTPISSTEPVVGTAYVGDATRSVVQLDHLHPILGISSSGTGSQWMVLSVHQVLKRFRPTAPEGEVRSLGVVRLESNSNVGYPLPMFDRGAERRVVSYHVSVLDASGSAQLGCTISHGADGARFAVQKTHAVASITAPSLVVYDCDLAKSIAPYVQASLRMQAVAGQWCVVEVWEITKTVRG
jgi:hypothetical protein